MHIDVPARRRAVIGLTPLIDVVFILLVFFMLASSFLDWRVIDLATGSSSPAEDRPPPAVVQIGADGNLHYQERALDADALARRLQERLRAGEISAVILQPRAGVSLGTAVGALDALAGAGIENLALRRGPSGER